MALTSKTRLAESILDPADARWLQQVIGEGQLLADLAFSDIVLWVKKPDDTFEAIAHLRPSSSATLFYRDVVGSAPRPEWLALMNTAYTTGNIVDSSKPDWYEKHPRSRASGPRVPSWSARKIRP